MSHVKHTSHVIISSRESVNVCSFGIASNTLAQKPEHRDEFHSSDNGKASQTHFKSSNSLRIHEKAHTILTVYPTIMLSERVGLTMVEAQAKAFFPGSDSARSCDRCFALHVIDPNSAFRASIPRMCLPCSSCGFLFAAGLAITGCTRVRSMRFACGGRDAASGNCLPKIQEGVRNKYARSAAELNRCSSPAEPGRLRLPEDEGSLQFPLRGFCRRFAGEFEPSVQSGR